MLETPAWRAMVALAVAAALLLFPAVGSAATFTVNDNGDQADPDVGTNGCDVGNGVCTLRAAIQEANFNSPQPDTINLSGVSGQIVLTSALPTIVDSVTINGPGADQLAIDGAGSHRVLDVQLGPTTIADVTITHGTGPLAGQNAFAGGVQSAAAVTLNHVVVTENTATGSDTTFGGGIYVATGTLTLEHSTVSDNTASVQRTGSGNVNAYGGGIYASTGAGLVLDHSTVSGNHASSTVTGPTAPSGAAGRGGGIVFDGPTVIDQSTISGNTASATGASDGNSASGGGFVEGNNGTLSVTGSTVSDNAVAASGGAPLFATAANVFLGSNGGDFGSSIVGNPAGGGNCVFNGDPAVSNGYNLDEDGSCGFDQTTDLTGDPKLGALADNGGPTQTQALLANSPAIDHGKSFGATTDQRGTGFPRISDSATIANATGGDGADIGAYERDVVPPSATAPVQRLVQGSQLGATTVPVRFDWTASDDVTPASQIQSFLQMRTNSSGTWSPFANLVGPTLAKGATASLSGSDRRQFRVRAKDQTGNFGNGSLGPIFRILILQEVSPAIAYTGTWHHASQSSAVGGGVQYSNQAGAKATLTSTGKNLAVVMPLRSTNGTVKICLDPGTPDQSCGTVDLSPATGLGARKEVFVRNGLNPTAAHKVVVTVLSGRADLDAFVALR